MIEKTGEQLEMIKYNNYICNIPANPKLSDVIWFLRDRVGANLKVSDSELLEYIKKTKGELFTDFVKVYVTNKRQPINDEILDSEVKLSEF